MMETVFGRMLFCALDEPLFFLAAIFLVCVLYRGREKRIPEIQLSLLNSIGFVTIEDDINKKISPFRISEINLRVFG